MSLSIRRISGCGAAADCAVAGWETTGAGVGGWLLVGFTASSRFHMVYSSAPKGNGIGRAAIQKYGKRPRGTEPMKYIGRSKLLSSRFIAGT
jgi:hypothetical protein